MPFSRNANRPGRGDERAAACAEAAGRFMVSVTTPSVSSRSTVGSSGRGLAFAVMIAVFPWFSSRRHTLLCFRDPRQGGIRPPGNGPAVHRPTNHRGRAPRRGNILPFTKYPFTNVFLRLTRASPLTYCAAVQRALLSSPGKRAGRTNRISNEDLLGEAFRGR